MEFSLIPIKTVSEKKVSVRMGLQSTFVPLMSKLKSEGKYDISQSALTNPLVPTIDKETGLQRVSSTGNPMFHLHPEVRAALTGFEASFNLQVQAYINQKPIEAKKESPAIEAKKDPAKK